MAETRNAAPAADPVAPDAAIAPTDAQEGAQAIPPVETGDPAIDPPAVDLPAPEGDAVAGVADAEVVAPESEPVEAPAFVAPRIMLGGQPRNSSEP